MNADAGMAPRGEPTTFEGCLARVNPTAESLAHLSSRPDDTPIIMLNLLRFRPRGDATIYGMYAREAAPEIEKTGSFVTFFGRALQDLEPDFGLDLSWDAVGLPVYRRCRSFLDLQASSAYQLAIPYRTAGASRRLLYPLVDGEQNGAVAHSVSDLGVSRSSLVVEPSEVLLLDLVQLADEVAREANRVWSREVEPLLVAAGAVSLLDLDTDVPVLSEDRWDRCSVIRFPDVTGLRSVLGDPRWHRAIAVRNAAVRRSTRLAAVPFLAQRRPPGGGIGTFTMWTHGASNKRSKPVLDAMPSERGGRSATMARRARMGAYEHRREGTGSTRNP